MIEKFIEKAKGIHGDKYDYSKVNYINANTKIIIICKKHGEFYKTPSKHTNSKQGCAKCSGFYIPTTDEFIKNAKLIHGDKYDYSKVDYKYSNENVIITCKVHGDFLQRPGNHINSKQGCPKCAGNINKSSQEFIEEVIKIHGNKYDYSKVNYINANTKVIIICKEHGEFEQIPSSHLNGNGCDKCAIIIRSNKTRKTLEEFIEKAILIHGDKYDYFKVNYIDTETKIIIICKEHGEFEQRPANHLKGQGCPKCGIILATNKNRKTFEEFIEKAILIHGDKYDYSKVNYINANTKVIIICKEHGEFEQIPQCHLIGHCCYKCSRINGAEKRKKTFEEFIEKAILIHGDKYDYSKVNYIDTETKIIIICKEHGEFKQRPSSHLKGHCCSICSHINGAEKRKTTFEEFIEKAILIHGDKYDYSKVNYIDTETKIIIICKEHGEFKQRPKVHYWHKSGCPKCNNNGYSKPQILWLDFLSKFYNINIQHALNDGEFVIPNTKYKADGYCKETNTIYEFHGDFWHGNPKVFTLDEINKKTNCTFQELYEKTIIKEEKIKELGYNLIVIWEYDWKKINNAVRTIQLKFLENYYY
jgi:ribosomal protein L36